MITIESVVVTPFSQNARLLIDTNTKSVVIVDPGGEIEKLLKPIEGYRVEAIILTHSHIDHAGGVAELLRTLESKGFERPPLIAGEESELRESIEMQANYFGLSSEGFENCPPPDLLLTPRQKVRLLGQEWEARFTPGHSPGHFSFVSPEGLEFKLIEGGESIAGQGQVVLAGDALFAGAIGRTDFPNCSLDQLLESIETELLSLPDPTIVLSGHGPRTTIGKERRTNPFLTGALQGNAR